jgi:F-type H+-transporting ATPase subunit epsilon
VPESETTRQAGRLSIVPLEVQLVSPEQVLFTGAADMVIARTMSGGDVAFLPGHAPTLGALATWPVRVIMSGGDERSFAVHGGFVEVSNDRVIILSDVAEVDEEIDVERAGASKRRAEEILRQQPENPEALAALARADVRLQVAEAARR